MKKGKVLLSIVILLTLTLGLTQGGIVAEAKTKKKASLWIDSYLTKLDITEGHTHQLRVVYSKNLKNVAKKAKYKIANKKICSIKKGKVVPKKDGTTKVTIKYKDAKTTIKVHVANSHYKRDVKEFVKNSGADYFALVSLDPKEKFKNIVTCKKGQGGYGGLTDLYQFYHYDCSYNGKKNESKFMVCDMTPKAIGLQYSAEDGTPLFDYNDKWCVVYGMMYTKILKNSPLEAQRGELISFREIEHGMSKLRDEHSITYSHDFTGLSVHEEPTKQATTLINYMGKNYYIYEKTEMENYNTYYKDRKTCKMIANTEENRNQFIK